MAETGSLSAAARLLGQTQLTIVRKVGEDRARPYATPDRLSILCHPRRWAELAGAAIVGFDQTERVIEALSTVGLDRTARNVPVHVNSQLVHWAFVRQGSASA